MWYGDYYDDHWDDDYDEDIVFGWYDGYKKWKAQNASIKKSPYPFLGIHQDAAIGVFLRMRKKKQKNCGDKYKPFLCQLTRYKNFLNKDVFYHAIFF